MTGKQALETVIEAMKSHYKTKPNEKPTRIEIHWDFAYDLTKLGRSDLGDLSDMIWKEGIEALEKYGLFGLKVAIDRKNEGSDVRIS